MALFQMNFESQYLGNNHTVSVILPDRPKNQDAQDFYSSGKTYQVMWLLHGTFGDHSDWVRKSMLEIYAREVNLICVMPSGMNADYENWPNFGTGYDMKSYLTKELMPLIYNWFPASQRREDNFIVGLSMGGRGALSYALDHPDLFAGAAMLSAAPEDPEKIDWDSLEKGIGDPMRVHRMQNQVKNAGGRDAYRANMPWNRFFDAWASGVALPKLYFCCGEKDSLYGSYCHFKQTVQNKHLPVAFHEMPDLAHEWRFWDPEIQNVLRYFGLTQKENTDTF